MLSIHRLSDLLFLLFSFSASTATRKLLLTFLLCWLCRNIEFCEEILRILQLSYQNIKSIINSAVGYFWLILTLEQDSDVLHLHQVHVQAISDERLLIAQVHLCCSRDYKYWFSKRNYFWRLIFEFVLEFCRVENTVWCIGLYENRTRSGGSVCFACNLIRRYAYIDE